MVSGESYTIKELSRITGYSLNTIRRYIKTGLLSAQMVKGAYQVSQGEAERVFKVGKSVENTQGKHLGVLIGGELVMELRDRIHQLESDKAFLQKQIMDLQDTIKMMTIRKLPGYSVDDTRGVFTKVKEFLVGKKVNI